MPEETCDDLNNFTFLMQLKKTKPKQLPKKHAENMSWI